LVTRLLIVVVLVSRGLPGRLCSFVPLTPILGLNQLPWVSIALVLIFLKLKVVNHRDDVVWLDSPLGLVLVRVCSAFLSQLWLLLSMGHLLSIVHPLFLRNILLPVILN